MNGRLEAWRNAEAWLGPCQTKRKDWTSYDRSSGADQARNLRGLFPDARSFADFSTAFNAVVVARTLRDALVREVQAMSGVVNAAAHHPLAACIRRYLQDGDMDAFVVSLEERARA